MTELEVSELGQRIVLVAPHHARSVFGAEVAQEEHEDQWVRLVTTRPEEAGRGNLGPLDLADVAEVFDLEEAS